jgi:hypothetical protein
MVTKKVYFIRHQAGGILTDVVFVGAPPSAADLDAAKERMDKVHGENHSKTGEAYWMTVQESCGVFPDGKDIGDFENAELPKPREENGVGEDGAPGLPRFVVTGTGTVTPGDPATAEARAAEKAARNKG